jgi:hypothetical protein
MEVINALGRKDTSVGALPYIEFNLEIESDDRELSVEFEQKRYGIYAEVEFEEEGKKISSWKVLLPWIICFPFWRSWKLMLPCPKRK